MNGPEHYREAERAVERARGTTPADAALPELALAQAHATLALVAATIDARDGDLPTNRWDAWMRAVK